MLSFESTQWYISGCLESERVGLSRKLTRASPFFPPEVAGRGRFSKSWRPRLAPTGHLLFRRESSLWAAPFQSPTQPLCNNSLQRAILDQTRAGAEGVCPIRCLREEDGSKCQTFGTPRHRVGERRYERRAFGNAAPSATAPCPACPVCPVCQTFGKPTPHGSNARRRV